MRALAIVAAALAAILFLLLASASANTDLLARHYPLLLGLNAGVAVALLGLVMLQLRTLWREYRQGQFGSRLKSRLLLMLALMAVLPGALVYGVSMQFAVNSIESWFDVRVESALEGGLNLGRGVLDSQLGDLLEKGRGMALDLGGEGPVRPMQLNRLREQAGASSATLFSASGRVLASSSSELGRLLPDMPSASQLRQAWQGRGLALIEGDAKSGLNLRALTPVSGDAMSMEKRVLQLTQTVSPSIARSAESVEEAYRDYQELSLGRQGLKRIYTLTLTLTLLLALFAAIALSFFLARRLVAPLLILAEGTRAVAAGDFTPRATLETTDELGLLTRSFNRMTHQLDEARREAEDHRGGLEEARAYLESVLASLSAGVLAFDRKFRLRASNRGAEAILGGELGAMAGRSLAEWSGHAAFRQAIREGYARGPEWQQQVDIERPGEAAQVLLLRGSTLPAAGGGGHVVVFDDITTLIAAQRAAAWGEVARRLAHEIKNPLTPIQLSAERLQHKLADKLDGAARELLSRATQTIVNQVEAMKNMVNNFRDYARQPPPQMQTIDLNALVREVLVLYETAEVRVGAELDASLPDIAGDPTQLRQVLHNLLANAQDALVDAAAREVAVATRRAAGCVLLTVRDSGGGFPPQILARAFEPYVTTKPKGSGLGLAIVKKIVDEHGGEIHIANLVPNGAEVSIRLPVASPSE